MMQRICLTRGAGYLPDLAEKGEGRHPGLHVVNPASRIVGGPRGAQ